MDWMTWYNSARQTVVDVLPVHYRVDMDNSLSGDRH